MFHLGFFMLPEPGHVLPSLNVARSLEQKGHQVTFLSTPALSIYFAKHGFQSCTIFKSAFPDTSTDILSAEEGTTVQRRLFNYLKATGGGFADLLAAEIVDLGFDILVCDAWIIRSFGDDLVRTLQIPIVSLSVVFPDQERKQVPSIPEVVLCPKELDIPTRTWKSNHAKTFFAEPSLFETGRQNKDAV